jgi:tetratricopeptide (TPR) repeat protein
VALFRLGDRAKAIDEFRESLRLDPGSAITHHAFGDLLEQIGSFSEAVTEYQAAIVHSPDGGSAEMHNDLGIALATANRLPEALVEFRAAVTRRPDFAEAHANLVRAQAALSVRRP